jgi:2-phospho-L-lactate guanylyltransferase
VVCESNDVEQWARDRGARCVRADALSDARGLDGAVAGGVAAAARDGADHVVVAHGDLPLARTFAHVPVADTVSLVADRHRDGTNVLSFPLTGSMTTAYGPGSFGRHMALAAEAGLAVVEIDDPDLALDLDTADDLASLGDRLVGSVDRRRDAGPDVDPGGRR